MAGEVIISVAYGIDVLPVNDPYISLAEEAQHSGGQAATPGRFLVVSFFLVDMGPAKTSAPGCDSGVETCARLVSRRWVQTTG